MPAVRRIAVALLAALALTACDSGRGGPDDPAPLPPIATDPCPAPADLLAPAARPATGRRLPDLTLECLGHAGTVSLRALGGRPTVLNLWASWCQPCRTEMPVFQKIHAELGSRVLILGVNSKDFPRPARATIQATGISYPSVADPGQRVRDGLRLIGLPDTVFVDAQGRIVAVQVGEMDERALRAALRQHFGIAA